MQLLLPTAALLHLAAAHVGDIAIRNSEVALITSTRRIPTVVDACGLPLPYAPINAIDGTALVHVVGRVVSRRRMARLLVFAHIVPVAGNDAVR